MKNKDSYRNIGQNISKYGSYSLIIVCAMHLLPAATGSFYLPGLFPLATVGMD